MTPTERIVIVGGPRTSKSTLAREFRLLGIPTYCGDPVSCVKQPEFDVTYLPEGIPFAGDDGAAQWVADNWFTLLGPFVVEGHVTARALRRWLYHPPLRGPQWPCDRIIVLREHHPLAQVTPGQRTMHRAVMTVWRSIADNFADRTQYR